MRAVAVLLCFATLLAARAASADEDPARRAQAQARFNEGLALHAQGNEREARLRFEQAYAVLGTPNTLLNLARSEQLTGDEVRAAQHYRECLKASRMAERTYELAKKFLDELERKLAQIQIVVPEGAQAIVDGSPVTSSLAETVYLQPGPHRVVARLGDAEQHAEGVATLAGNVTTVRLLQDLLIVARVDAPPAASPAQPPHNSGQPAPSAQSDATEPRNEQASFWTTRHTVAVILGATAVTAAGVGIGVGLAANGQKSTLESLQASGGPSGCLSGAGGGGECSSRADAANAARSDAVVANVAFALAGGFAVAGVAVFLWPGSTRTHTARVWLAPAGSGAVVGGQF